VDVVEEGRFMSAPVLQTHGLLKRFGGLVATNEVNLSVQRGARHALIGPNGAGNAVADEVTEVAERFGLADVLERRTDTLPYGKQRLLEIAAAFACAPKVLLLDEPAAGVPEAERRDILNAIAALPDDVSVLLIEHDMDLVFNFAKSVTVLVNGAVFAEGDVQTISNDPRVKAVYLGEAVHG
jgi:branched-chain amino acid transport system ATP-binding protein